MDPGVHYRGPLPPPTLTVEVFSDIFKFDFENILVPFWVKPGLDDLCLTLLQRMHFGDRKLHQSLVRARITDTQ